MTAPLAPLRRTVLIIGVCSALPMTCAQEATAQQRLYQRSGAHFAVMFEGPADEAVAFRALEMLEAAYYRIGTALNVYPGEPVEVVLHTLEQFRDVTKSAAWAAGVYDGRIRIPIKDADRSPDQLAEVLAHEYTHAIVATLAGGSAPTWLNPRTIFFWASAVAGRAPATKAVARAGLRVSRLIFMLSPWGAVVGKTCYGRRAAGITPAQSPS